MDFCFQYVNLLEQEVAFCKFHLFAKHTGVYTDKLQSPPSQHYAQQEHKRKLSTQRFSFVRQKSP